tara:strand:- start:610 stop:1170 length:561 start_codon:yes stop_codon:yes gene_type:complete
MNINEIANKKVFIIGGICILIATIITSIILIRKKNMKYTEYDVILMGGLDNRKGDKTISEQVSLLEKNANNKKIIGYRYNDISGVKEMIKNYPNAIVVLFSAGASFSAVIAELITDKNKLFIVEPYATSVNVTKSVKYAVSKGVPNKNVITGASSSRGNGVVEKSTKTPTGIGHWGALEFVGNLLK